MSETVLDEEAREARRAIIGNAVTLDVFGRALGLSHRALYGYLDQGLPSFVVGRTRYVRPDEARQFLANLRPLKKEKTEPPPPRGRGRPKGSTKSASTK